MISFRNRPIALYLICFPSGITHTRLQWITTEVNLTLDLCLYQRAARLLHWTGVIYDGTATHLIPLVTITFYTHHLTMKRLHNKSCFTAIPSKLPLQNQYDGHVLINDRVSRVKHTSTGAEGYRVAKVHYWTK